MTERNYTSTQKNKYLTKMNDKTITVVKSIIIYSFRNGKTLPRKLLSIIIVSGTHEVRQNPVQLYFVTHTYTSGVFLFCIFSTSVTERFSVNRIFFHLVLGEIKTRDFLVKMTLLMLKK